MLIKVLVADDNDVMRGAIVNLLNEEPSTELMGEAKGFAQTIQLAYASVRTIYFASVMNNLVTHISQNFNKSNT
jgi:DNA-binding NarL/FixJ family response regulator